MVGKPPGFVRMLVELLALLSAPDRSGQPVTRNCFGPHPACPTCWVLNCERRAKTITPEAEICFRCYVLELLTMPMFARM
jgi:hypothetical protein